MDEGKNNDIKLGEVIGELRGAKEQLLVTNAAVSKLTEKVSTLHCAKHEDDIAYLLSCQRQDTADSQYKTRARNKWWRDFMIALVAAVITGCFSLLGAWMMFGHQVKQPDPPASVNQTEETVPTSPLPGGALFEGTYLAPRTPSSPSGL